MRQNSSKVIGVAGGVGSGKSTVLDILRRKHDAVICMADELGHEVMRPGTAGELCAWGADMLMTARILEIIKIRC